MRSPNSLVAVLVAFLLAGGSMPQARGADEGLGPKGVLSWFQKFVHTPMVPHESPRDLTRFRFVRKAIPESGSERIVTEPPPGCGMTVFERLPRDEAIRLLRVLFGLYGFPQRPDHVLELGGVAARLDGYDPNTLTGFVLVRGDVKPRAVHDPSRPPRAPLPADVDLDLSEWKTLSRRGHRILRVPEDRFVGMPPNTFVPLLACLVDAVDWLNGIAKGPDFDVDAFLGKPIKTSLPDLAAADLPLAQPLQQDEHGIFAVLKASALVTLDLGASVPRPARRQGPVLLVLPFSWLPPFADGGFDFEAADLDFVLEQRTTKTQRLRVRSRRPVFLLPPTFDPSKPFRIRLRLPRGQTTLSRDLTIFGASQ